MILHTLEMLSMLKNVPFSVFILKLYDVKNGVETVNINFVTRGYLFLIMSQVA